MTRRNKVTLEGTEALTIRETRALIEAAIAGCTRLHSSKWSQVGKACEKLAAGLIFAGQSRESVEALMPKDDTETTCRNCGAALEELDDGYGTESGTCKQCNEAVD